MIALALSQRVSEGDIMRIATLILGLIFGLILFLQTLLGSGLSSLAEDEGAAESSAVGLFASILWLVASALVIGFPLASTIIFGISSLFLFGASGNFPDLAIWGGVALFLAAMSFFGWRGKKKDAREKAEERLRQQHRDEQMEQMMRQQQSSSIGTQSDTVRCPSCGSSNQVETKFCGNCGHALSAVGVGSH
jgi:hypothetical protein